MEPEATIIQAPRQAPPQSAQEATPSLPVVHQPLSTSGSAPAAAVPVEATADASMEEIPATQYDTRVLENLAQDMKAGAIPSGAEEGQPRRTDAPGPADQTVNIGSARSILQEVSAPAPQSAAPYSLDAGAPSQATPAHLAADFQTVEKPPVSRPAAPDAVGTVSSPIATGSADPVPSSARNASLDVHTAPSTSRSRSHSPAPPIIPIARSRSQEHHGSSTPAPQRAPSMTPISAAAAQLPFPPAAVVDQVVRPHEEAPTAVEAPSSVSSATALLEQQYVGPSTNAIVPPISRAGSRSPMLALYAGPSGVGPSRSSATSAPPLGHPADAEARPALSRPNSALGQLPTTLQQGATGPAKTLNVKDALSYLDQVKVRFQDRLDVYNQFLDVMKEFKTQAIDTPGVIERVSLLFRGHPALIQGFNTFLPPGYRIECSVIEGPLNTLPMPAHRTIDSSAQGTADLITVFTPAGISTTTTLFPRGVSEPLAIQTGMLPISWKYSISQSPTAQTLTAPPPPSSAPQSPNGLRLSALPTPSLGTGTMGTPIATPGAAHVLGLSAMGRPPGTGSLEAAAMSAASGSSQGKQGPVEFNHAIQYVNRIKSRFIDRPDIYKEFLEILQRYQKEQRPIQDVYAQVTALFKDATDLLEEFKAFLPDLSNPGQHLPFGRPPGPGQQGLTPGAGLFSIMSQSGSQPPVAGPSRTTSPSIVVTEGAPGPSPVAGVKRGHSFTSFNQGERMPPADGQFPPAPKKKRATLSNQPPPPSAQSQAPPQAKDLGAPRPPAASQSLDAAANRPAKVSKRGKHRAVEPVEEMWHAKAEPYAIEVVPQPAPMPGVAAYPAYVDAHGAMQGRTLTSAREMTFFEQARRYLGGKEAWSEFLRVCSLFTQGIIDFRTLMDRASVFIGDNDDLLEDFKGLVGYDVTEDGLVEDEVWEIKNTPLNERARIDPSSIPSQYGSSYKRLPPAEVDLACSGRDALCWSVLNDHYFAAAVWGSESGTFHRKSFFEDVCHAVEHERSHYSYWLDTISRTIAHFEAVEARIHSMDDQERHNFRLGYSLGGQSPSIYTRALRKIYEGKYRSEVQPLLEEHPAATVPVVLRRLKEVEQAWKHAELQWQVVWREVEKKNFYRSLDAIGTHPTYKASEKTAIKGATLIKELRDLRDEGIRKTVLAEGADHTPARPTHQFELGFEDEEVSGHMVNFLAMFVERTSTTKPERKRAWEVLRTVIPLLGVPADEIEHHFPPVFDDDSESDSAEEEQDDEDDEVRSDAGTSVTGATDSANRKSVATKGGVADLRKRLLSAKSAAAHATDGEESASHKVISPAPSSPPEVDPESELPVRDEASSSEEEEFPRQEPTQPVMEGATLTMPALGDWANAGNCPSDRAWSEEPTEEQRHNLFCTSQVYVAFRTMHILYSRLLELKRVAERLNQQEPPWHRVNPIAVELGLTFVIPGIDDHPRPASQLYPFIMDQYNRYCSFEIEMPVLEEELRVLFPLDGYKLLSADKLCQSIYKQLASILVDHKGKQLLELFKEVPKDASAQKPYRRKAESLMQGEELYRVEWIPGSRRMTLQLIQCPEPTPQINEPNGHSAVVENGDIDMADAQDRPKTPVERQDLLREWIENRGETAPPLAAQAVVA